MVCGYYELIQKDFELHVLFLSGLDDLSSGCGSGYLGRSYLLQDFYIENN
jgi:hypothetical protein